MGKKRNQAVVPADGDTATAKDFADMTPEEQAEYVAALEEKNTALAADKKTLESKVGKDLTFKVNGRIFDFNKKQFHLPGIGLVNVEKLIDEDPKQFDAVCAKLIELGSGFIHPIE